MHDGWVRAYEGRCGDTNWLEHLGGVDWFSAPVPRRWHRCAPQSRGRWHAQFVERCACGAIRVGEPGTRRQWRERNAARRRRGGHTAAARRRGTR